MVKKVSKDWVKSTLGNIADWSSGGTPSRAIQNYYDGNIPWVKTGDLTNDKILKVDEYISEEGLNNSSAKIFPKGSVVIAMYGATIGKTGLLDFDAATNQACAVGIPKKCSNIFLHYLLKSEKQKFIEKGKGGAQPNISLGVIKSHEILLPPLEDQKQIVKKLDQLFGHLENIKARLEKIPELLKQFRQAVLTQAVTGKLTEEWREGKKLENVDSFLKQIANQRKIRIEKKDDKKTRLENFEQFQIPKTWRWVRLWDLSFLITSGSRDWSKYYSESGAHFVRSAEINDNTLRLEETIFVDLPEKVEGKRSLIQKGDLLITITGANVGKCAKINSDIEESYVSQSVALVKLVDPKLVEYIHLNMLSPKTGKRMLEDMAYGMGRPVLSLPQIKSVFIPMPPQEEQNEIIKVTQRFLEKADEIENRYKKLKEQLDQLQPALLAKAFRGEMGYR
jgi:type I restriction enzyme S subunit